MFKNLLKSTLAPLALVVITALPSTAQFALHGDGRVNPDDFELTTFAADLNYPVGMVELPDHSILVAVSIGGSFFSSSSSQILRLVDADDDGVSETREVIVDRLSIGGPSALRMAGDLLFISGQGSQIAILRLGPAPAYEVTEVGRLTINYSGRWLHPQSALQARLLSDGVYELYFPLGSRVNFATTTATLPLTSTIGIEAELAGDAIHRVRFRDEGGTLVGIDHEQIATGLRSASGLAFHPRTGDLYFEDNGIDGLVEAIEAHSADEVNMIPLAQIGGEIEDFGFPGNHTAYRTGEFVGGQDIPPVFAFTPLPNPADGSESEGPNEIAFAPPGFPEGLNNGLFVGFHGQFSRGGLSNEENPLVFADLQTGSYFHFVGNDEPGVGHLDGLLATRDRLYVADISSNGGFGSSGGGTGFIYRIRYTGDPPTAILEVEGQTPDGFAMGEAYPNPFNPATTIDFQIPAAGDGQHAILRVYDITGRVVTTLMNDVVTAGNYQAGWDGTDAAGRAVASGGYLFELRVGDVFAQTQRVTLLK
ncbi:MAG: hypothetical protein HOC05_16440 [Gemmatimonadetes bacterium]|jgi:glucose/arabinose dehydrogenase|nr:hypothetical protein [Gemmatimonadota bacterium]MBT4611632.1 hypothetical protein [Gemmatimonadota bacterium]MBT5145751.1 hypothetical protein [Gemmatimonadota bacterium]MBT5588019.1 hypothetical protein [Gemmatimonadota bacterium]MBT5960815.1 hypothetical protein [Gemmatimonadota bacterium]